MRPCTTGAFVCGQRVKNALVSNISEHVMHRLSHLHVSAAERKCGDLTGRGQRCPGQTGPGEEGGVPPGGNKLPQEAAR